MTMLRFLAASRSALAAVLLFALVSTGCTYSRKFQEEGLRLYTEKMYSDAAGAFRAAIRQDPRDYHSQFYLGVCYEQMGQLEQVFQEYYAALGIMAMTDEGRFDWDFRQVVLDTLANAIAKHDNHEVELNKAETNAKAGQKAETWFLVAKVYRLKGDADMAITAYRSAANCDPWNFQIRKEFGLYLLEPLHQPREAEYYLRQAYRLEPNDEGVNTALARMGVVPLPAYKPKDPIPRKTPPYAGPLPTGVQRLSGDSTAPQPRALPGRTVAAPRD